MYWRIIELPEASIGPACIPGNGFGGSTSGAAAIWSYTLSRMDGGLVLITRTERRSSAHAIALRVPRNRRKLHADMAGLRAAIIDPRLENI